MKKGNEVLMNTDGDIMVSIWCSTYNHARYIKDALDGFLAQMTTFRYEVFIHDDASTDGTSEIVRNYMNKYPQIIRAVIEKENIWENPKRSEIHLNYEKKYTKGKYIAFCDGDDYWIDCYKLQMQVNYMESHPECSLCLHNGLWLDCRNGSMWAGNPYSGLDDRDLSPEEVIMLYRGHPPTASMLLKRELIEGPEFFHKMYELDWPMQLYGLAKGSVHYMSRIMSVYRWYSEGSCTQKLVMNKEYLFVFELGMVWFLIQYNEYTNYKYHIWITDRIQTYVSSLIHRMDMSMSLKEYYSLCEKQGYHFPSQDCTKCLDEMERVRKQTFDMTFCSETVKKITKKYAHIIIMGTGRYGTIIGKQFESNGIEFSGFAVSEKNENTNCFMGKPVWRLSEIPFDRHNTGIVVGINPLRWDDILYSLKSAGIEHYYCPFLLEEEMA